MPPTSQTAIVAAIVSSSVSATRITKPTDFDAIQSIPFDDDHNHLTSVAIDGDNSTTDNNAHAGVLKKLTSYFSSSHKTLINLNNNNHSKNGCKRNPSANSNHSTDTCAVFENCNAVRSSSSSSSLSSAASSLPSTSSSSLVASAVAAAANAPAGSAETAQVKTGNESTMADESTQPQTTIGALTNLNSINRNSKNSCSSSSSSSLSANSMEMLCGDKRDVDKCDEILNKNNKITNHKNKNNNNVHKSGKSLSVGIDGRASTAAAAVAKARSPNKRVQKIDDSGGGESFTLPRVVLRQR